MLAHSPPPQLFYTPSEILDALSLRYGYGPSTASSLWRCRDVEIIHLGVLGAAGSRCRDVDCAALGFPKTWRIRVLGNLPEIQNCVFAVVAAGSSPATHQAAGALGPKVSSWYALEQGQATPTSRPLDLARRKDGKQHGATEVPRASPTTRTESAVR